MNPFPYILAGISGKARYRPNIMWSSKSWVHNTFRLFELIFWRQIGIRAESCSWTDGVRTLYTFHSLEAFLAYVEGRVRGLIPKMRMVRVYLPLFAPATGPLFGRPYLLAIALDTTSTGNTTTTETTASHVITGSDTILIMGIGDQDSLEANITGVTYAGVSLTKIDGQQTNTDPSWSHLYGKLSPTTGTNTASATRTTASDALTICNASYTGVDQGTAIGSLPFGANAGSGTSGSATTSTAVPNNGWVTMVTYNRLQGEAAGADTVQRVNSGNHENLWDSDGPRTPSAAQTLAFTQTDNHWGAIIVGFGPSTGTATTPPGGLLLLLGVG